MRTRTILPVGLLLLLTVCAGNKARELALWPTVAGTWPAVKADIERGIAGGPPTTVVAAIGQVDAAVCADDYSLLHGLDWSLLEPLARAGVQALVDRSEISEGVAVSLLERISRFSEAMEELIR